MKIKKKEYFNSIKLQSNKDCQKVRNMEGLLI